MTVSLINDKALAQGIKRGESLPPKTFYIGIKGLIVIDNKVLALKGKSSFGKIFWDLPGGRMSEGEEIEDTLRRELQEEILTIKDIHIHDLMGIYRLPHNLKDGHGLLFLAYRVSASLPTIELSHEHTGYQWVSKIDIDQLGKDGIAIDDCFRQALQSALQGNYT